MKVIIYVCVCQSACYLIYQSMSLVCVNVCLNLPKHECCNEEDRLTCPGRAVSGGGKVAAGVVGAAVVVGGGVVVTVTVGATVLTVAFPASTRVALAPATVAFTASTTVWLFTAAGVPAGTGEPLTLMLDSRA